MLYGWMMFISLNVIKNFIAYLIKLYYVFETDIKTDAKTDLLYV